MTMALAAVLLSAACAGTANVLQAREARRFSAAPAEPARHNRKGTTAADPVQPATGPAQRQPR